MPSESHLLSFTMASHPLTLLHHLYPTTPMTPLCLLARASKHTSSLCKNTFPPPSHRATQPFLQNADQFSYHLTYSDHITKSCPLAKSSSYDTYHLFYHPHMRGPLVSRTHIDLPFSHHDTDATVPRFSRSRLILPPFKTLQLKLFCVSFPHSPIYPSSFFSAPCALLSYATLNLI